MEWTKIESLNQFRQSSWHPGFYQYLVASFDSYGIIEDSDIVEYKSVDPINDHAAKDFYSSNNCSWYDTSDLLKRYTHFILLDQPERASEKTPEKEMRCAEPDGNTGR